MAGETNGLSIVHEVARGLSPNGTQRCILCGAIILDYRGAKLDTPEQVYFETGYMPGPVTVTVIKNTTAVSSGILDGAIRCLNLSALDKTEN